MRINIESIFVHFDERFSVALTKALLATVPGMTPKMALRTYHAFRRNAIGAMSQWEAVPAELFADTVTGVEPGRATGISLPPTRQR